MMVLIILIIVFIISLIVKIHQQSKRIFEQKKVIRITNREKKFYRSRLNMIVSALRKAKDNDEGK